MNGSIQEAVVRPISSIFPVYVSMYTAVTVAGCILRVIVKMRASATRQFAAGNNVLCRYTDGLLYKAKILRAVRCLLIGR